MTAHVGKIVEGLRKAGFIINPLRESHLWHVDGRGNMSTGQLIDLASKLRMAAEEVDSRAA